MWNLRSMCACKLPSSRLWRDGNWGRCRLLNYVVLDWNLKFEVDIEVQTSLQAYKDFKPPLSKSRTSSIYIDFNFHRWKSRTSLQAYIDFKFLGTYIGIYHRGIQGCQYLSSDYDRLSSVQLHPYSVMCIAGGFHLAEDSPCPQPRLLWFCKHAPKNCRKRTERYGLLKSQWLSVWWTIFSAFQQLSSFVDDSSSTSISPCFDFITSRNGGLASENERDKGRKARRRDVSILWYRKSQSVEHGDRWNINCSAEKNSEPWYLCP
jgi:hypothetical protein